MKNYKIMDHGLLNKISLVEINSKEEFAILILKNIHQLINKEKHNLFPCGCDCINRVLLIKVYSRRSSLLRFHFRYSLEIGFFPFNKVTKYYPKFSRHSSINMYLKVNKICQIHNDIEFKGED